MDNRIDAIYGRQSIDKKDSISIESQFEFCRYELKGGEGREYKVTPARILNARTSSGFCRTSSWGSSSG